MLQVVISNVLIFRGLIHYVKGVTGVNLMGGMM
jgi:hypothetical protein